MGQKINPYGMRLGINKYWISKWYDESNFVDNLIEDYNIRKFLNKKLYDAFIVKIEIEKTINIIKIIIYTSKPGIIIGKNGMEIEKTRVLLKKYTNKKIIIDIKEEKNPDKNAQLISKNIALQLENRIAFRRAMKFSIQKAIKAGVKGIKCSISGRLNGADIARTESYSTGNIPLQTFKSDIDYGFTEANTTYGKIGVKIWIYNGDILPKLLNNNNEGDFK